MELYTNILKGLGMAPDDNDMIMMDGEQVKVTVKRAEGDKRLPLALPTDKRLSGEDQQSFAYFHPMGESLFRGNSEVLNLLIKAGRLTLEMYLKDIMLTLFTLAHDDKAHRKQTQNVVENYLVPIGKVSDATMKWLKTYLANCDKAKRGCLDGLFTLNVHRDKEGARPKAFWRLNYDFAAENKEFKFPSQTARTAFEAVLSKLPAHIEEQSEARFAPGFCSLMLVMSRISVTLRDIAGDIKRYREIDIAFPKITYAQLEDACEWYRNKVYIQLEGNVGLGKNGEPDAPVSKKPNPLTAGEVEKPAPGSQSTHTTSAPANNSSDTSGLSLAERKALAAREVGRMPPPQSSYQPHPQQPVQQPAYPGQPMPQQVGYPNHPMQGNYPNYPQQPGQGGYPQAFPNQPMQGNYPNYPQQPGQGGHPNQGYPQQPQYPQGYPQQAGYPNQGYPHQQAAPQQPNDSMSALERYRLANPDRRF